MANRVSNVVLSTNPSPKEIIRRTANFRPSIWGDTFTTYIPPTEEHRAREEQEIEDLKSQVRKELNAAASKCSLIDDIERLGVGYLFEKQIELPLQNIYDEFNSHKSANDDLYSVSLCFRLLRQHGHKVSSDIFNKFQDQNGNFKQSLIEDTRGMLSLYEAAHLMGHGENILDDALEFTTTHLKSLANLNYSNSSSSSSLMNQVSYALKRALHRCIPRVENRRYISIYEDQPSCNQSLLRLAKLNFNIVQSLHKEELAQIIRWWKNLDFARKLPFARDRVVECYFWIVSVYFEPCYSRARAMATKIIAMISIIDDIYDAYGTIEELEIFKQAINRWESGSMDQLPEYMQICYEALLNLCGKIEEELAKEGRSYRVPYWKQTMKDIVKAYFEEAKWIAENYIPSVEEYMRVALVTAGNTMITAASFIGMDNAVTKESFEWVFSRPKIITVSEVICRIMNDVRSLKFEQERGNVASTVECYKKQYGLSEQKIYEELKKQLANAWKEINEEWMESNKIVPIPVLACVLNFTRATDVIYQEEDGYTLVGKLMQNNIASLFKDPVPIF